MLIVQFDAPMVEAHVPIVNVVSEKGKLIGIVTNLDITKVMTSKLPMPP